MFNKIQKSIKKTSHFYQQNQNLLELFQFIAFLSFANIYCTWLSEDSKVFFKFESQYLKIFK